MALFWEHIEFQNRTVAIWEELARRYKGNTWVAGYNPLNEPCDEEHVRLLAFYDRVEKAIRAVDPEHILFWDGNTWAVSPTSCTTSIEGVTDVCHARKADFSHFKDALPNSVYSIHDYSNYGFPAGGVYTGSEEQKGVGICHHDLEGHAYTTLIVAKMLRSYKRKTEFQDRIGGPIWNGDRHSIFT